MFPQIATDLTTSTSQYPVTEMVGSILIVWVLPVLLGVLTLAFIASALSLEVE